MLYFLFLISLSYFSKLFLRFLFPINMKTNFFSYFREYVWCSLSLLKMEESRELWLIGPEMIEWWRWCGESEEKKRKYVNFLPKRIWQISHITGCLKWFLLENICFFWIQFDRHLCIVLLIMEKKNVLRSFCSLGQISYWRMYEIIKNIEKEI